MIFFDDFFFAKESKISPSFFFEPEEPVLAVTVRCWCWLFRTSSPETSHYFAGWPPDTRSAQGLRQVMEPCGPDPLLARKTNTDYIKIALISTD